MAGFRLDEIYTFSWLMMTPTLELSVEQRHFSTMTSRTTLHPDQPALQPQFLILPLLRDHITPKTA